MQSTSIEKHISWQSCSLQMTQLLTAHKVARSARIFLAGHSIRILFIAFFIAVSKEDRLDIKAGV